MYTVTIGGSGGPVHRVLSVPASLMSATIMPTVTTQDPNGHGCGTCTNASATASIGSS